MVKPNDFRSLGDASSPAANTVRNKKKMGGPDFSDGVRRTAIERSDKTAREWSPYLATLFDRFVRPVVDHRRPVRKSGSFEWALPTIHPLR